MHAQIHGLLAGFISNLGFFLFLWLPNALDHVKIFSNGMIYTLIYLTICVAILFLPGKRDYAAGALCAFSFSIIAFLAVQGVVVLAYWLS